MGTWCTALWKVSWKARQSEGDRPVGGRKSTWGPRDGKEQDVLGNIQETGCFGHKVDEQRDEK